MSLVKRAFSSVPKVSKLLSSFSADEKFILYIAFIFLMFFTFYHEGDLADLPYYPSLTGFLLGTKWVLYLLLILGIYRSLRLKKFSFILPAVILFVLSISFHTKVNNALNLNNSSEIKDYISSSEYKRYRYHLHKNHIEPLSQAQYCGYLPQKQRECFDKLVINELDFLTLGTIKKICAFKDIKRDKVFLPDVSHYSEKCDMAELKRLQYSSNQLYELLVK